jgi:hypothetical protein
MASRLLARSFPASFGFFIARNNNDAKLRDLLLGKFCKLDPTALRALGRA